MITLQDRPSAQYLEAGVTVLPGVARRLPALALGRFHVYLGVLTPAALRQAVHPGAEELMNGALSGFLRTLFAGVVSGTATVGRGLPKLSDIVASAQQQRAMVKTESTFLQALCMIKALAGNWCLPFELVVTPAKEMLVKSNPFNLQLTQDGQRLYGVAFQADRPVRIQVSDGAAQPVFDVVVVTR